MFHGVVLSRGERPTAPCSAQGPGTLRLCPVCGAVPAATCTFILSLFSLPMLAFLGGPRVCSPPAVAGDEVQGPAGRGLPVAGGAVPPRPLSPSNAQQCHSEGCMCCRWPQAVPKPPREELIASWGDLSEGFSPSLLPVAFSSCCLGLAAVLCHCAALAITSLGAVVQRPPWVGGSVPYHGGLWPLSYSEMHSLCSTEH